MILDTVFEHQISQVFPYKVELFSKNFRETSLKQLQPQNHGIIEYSVNSPPAPQLKSIMFLCPCS